MTALVLIDHADGHVSPASRSAITAALALGEVHVLVAGSGIAAVATQAAAIAGVAKVLTADAAALAHLLAEPLAVLLESLAGPYGHILAGSTTVGKNVMPRLAALLDVQPISDIVAVVDGDTFVRPIYAGNALATVRSSDTRKLLTVRAANFDAASPDGGTATIDAVAIPELPASSRFVSAELSTSERPELASARVVVSGGRGMQNGENFKLLDPIADSLGAAIGASRAAVDAGYVPNDYQVGQTGKIVAPDLYVAIGISGAIQHLAGMKDSKVIVAINKDPDAPIFQVADYGLVADLFTAIPELDKALKAA
jgi:electron transfer flavoprotein alpha subunit